MGRTLQKSRTLVGHPDVGLDGTVLSTTRGPAELHNSADGLDQGAQSRRGVLGLLLALPVLVGANGSEHLQQDPDWHHFADILKRLERRVLDEEHPLRHHDFLTQTTVRGVQRLARLLIALLDGEISPSMTGFAHYKEPKPKFGPEIKYKPLGFYYIDEVTPFAAIRWEFRQKGTEVGYYVEKKDFSGFVVELCWPFSRGEFGKRYQFPVSEYPDLASVELKCQELLRQYLERSSSETD